MWRELLAEVPHVRLRVDLLRADDALERLAGGELAAVPVEVLPQPVAEWREVASFCYGEFFPLTEYTDDESTWMAWQWGSSDDRSGVVQAFRREKSPFTSARFRLRHLKEDTRYTVEDLDSHSKPQISGKDLMEKGVPVEIQTAPGALILKYSETAAGEAQTSGSGR